MTTTSGREPMTEEYALARAVHCWVDVDLRGKKLPALLLTWREGRRGWEAQVIVADRGVETGPGSTAVMRWVAGGQVWGMDGRPASTP